MVMNDVWLRIILFFLFTIGIAYLSRDSLRTPSRHGFARFFAFEALLLLILANGPHWFSNPLSPMQIVSWVLLLASLLLALHGFYLLRLVGKPRGRIEDTTNLVTVGAYRYIRHPLYASLLLLGWGAFLKAPSAVGVALIGVIVAALAITARVEEKENLARFGQAYAAYMQKTKMFIPWLF